MRYLRGGLAIILVVLLGLVLLSDSPSTPSRFLLAPGREVRVLDVSLGTQHVLSKDPRWKKLLKNLRPGRLLQRAGESSEWHALPRQSTLAVWLELKEDSGRPGPWDGARAVALLEDGITANARVAHAAGRVLRLEFASFARDQARVPLELQIGTNIVPFAVRNPRPVTPAAWRAGVVPQTNVVLHTAVILDRPQFRRTSGSPAEPAMSGRARIRAWAKPAPRWLSWRVTTFDDLGNWASHGVQHSDWVTLPMLPRTNSVWQVVAEGTEYISAGFLEARPAGGAARLVLDPRSTAHGVRELLHVNAGAHTVEVPAVQALPGQPPGPAGKTWPLRFETEAAGILCVTETAPSGSIPSVRVRERLPDNRGRIFLTRRQWSITNSVSGRLRVASFYRPTLTSDGTNLEAEVVATLPPATFHFRPPIQAER